MTPIPKVTRDAVEQMVRRDFPAEQFEKIVSILDEIKKDTEEARASFQLNILKLSHGKLDLVLQNIDTFYTNYVTQPVPKVTRRHVERIIRRDFPTEQAVEVMAVLGEYGKESLENEVERVQLAVLKLAGGKVDELRKAMKSAKCDYRDVLSWAEYPSHHGNTFKLSAEEKKEIFAQDWKQYIEWANAK